MGSHRQPLLMGVFVMASIGGSHQLDDPAFGSIRSRCCRIACFSFLRGALDELLNPLGCSTNPNTITNGLPAAQTSEITASMPSSGCSDLTARDSLQLRPWVSLGCSTVVGTDSSSPRSSSPIQATIPIRPRMLPISTTSRLTVMVPASWASTLKGCRSSLSSVELCFHLRHGLITGRRCGLCARR